MSDDTIWLLNDSTIVLNYLNEKVSYNKTMGISWNEMTKFNVLEIIWNFSSYKDGSKGMKVTTMATRMSNEIRRLIENLMENPDSDIKQIFNAMII